MSKTEEARALWMAAKIIRDNAPRKGRVLINGLESMAADMIGPTPQINKTDTLTVNLRRYPITFDRVTLNYMYQEIGIIRSAIDMPVDDALRGGVEWESDELDADDLKTLNSYWEDNGVYEVLKTAMKWTRLFGGGGIMINCEQDPSTPLDVAALTPKSALELWDVDRWELSMPNDDKRPDNQGLYAGRYFYYYAAPVDRSRIIALKGDTAPSLTRRMLMGWGLSDVEKMVRDLNQYIKAQDMIFELIDQAKIDVYRLEGFKSGLASKSGDTAIRRRVATTNQLKNFLNAIVMDTKDEYEQKQITFSGLAEIIKEIRIGIASTLRMPVTKLFGISASGFNSGEDDIENYNAMIDSDIRSRLKPAIAQLNIPICQKLFGYVPESLSFKYKSLRIMSQNEEQDMKGKQQTRALELYDRALINGKETLESLRAEGLLTSEKSATEKGMTEDFPVPPIQRITQTIKEEDPNANPANDEKGKKDGKGKLFTKDQLREDK